MRIQPLSRTNISVADYLTKLNIIRDALTLLREAQLGAHEGLEIPMDVYQFRNISEWLVALLLCNLIVGFLLCLHFCCRSAQGLRLSMREGG